MMALMLSLAEVVLTCLWTNALGLCRDRVDHENGSFGHYLIAKECIQFKIPDNLTFEQATTLGVSIVTVVR